jgi:hypothetical protein
MLTPSSRARAASDRLWRSMHAHEDVPFRVSSMPQQIFDAWTRVDLKSGHADAQQNLHGSLPMVFMHPDRLIKLRDMVISRPLVPTNSIIDLGAKQDEYDRHARFWYLESQRILKKNKRDKDRNVHNGNSMTLDKMREVQYELDMAKERLKALAEEEDTGSSAITIRGFPTSEPSAVNHSAAKIMLLASSPLAGVRIGRSASSKLNYILGDVCECSNVALSDTYIFR